VNRGTIGVNTLPNTVTRQRRGCDLNPGPSAPESSTLPSRLPSHPLHTVFNYILKDVGLSCFFRNSYFTVGTQWNQRCPRDGHGLSPSMGWVWSIFWQLSWVGFDSTVMVWVHRLREIRTNCKTFWFYRLPRTLIDERNLAKITSLHFKIFLLLSVRTYDKNSKKTLKACDNFRLKITKTYTVSCIVQRQNY